MRPIGLALGLAALAALAQAQTPTVNAGGTVNAASYSTQGVAPGSIIAIFGTNLASSLSFGSTIPLSTKLNNIDSVTFNGVDAGMFYANGNQIDAQLPFESAPANGVSGTVSIVVTTKTGVSTAQKVTVLPTLPGIFTTNEAGTGQAIATDNADNAIAAAAGSVAGLTTHPFSLSTQGTNGHALVIWCTGLGEVSPTIKDGENSVNANGSITLRKTVVQPLVMVGGVEASDILFSGLAPAYVGLYQVDVLLGKGTPTGNAVPVQIQMNGVTTSSSVTVAIGN